MDSTGKAMNIDDLLSFIAFLFRVGLFADAIGIFIMVITGVQP